MSYQTYLFIFSRSSKTTTLTIDSCFERDSQLSAAILRSYHSDSFNGIQFSINNLPVEDIDLACCFVEEIAGADASGVLVLVDLRVALDLVPGALVLLVEELDCRLLGS